MSARTNKALLAAILASEKAGELAVVSRTPSDLLTDDFREDRMISYHIVPPDEAWILSLLASTPRAASTGLVLPAETASLLLSIDPDMLVNLRKIVFIGDSDGPEDICRILDADPEEYPDCMDPDAPDKPLGCAWIAQGAVLIDLSAILRTADEIAPEPGLAYAEALIGAWTTLLHEIRHLGLSDPFLPEERYPEELLSEESVEAWAIEAYEAWRSTACKRKT